MFFLSDFRPSADSIPVRLFSILFSCALILTTSAYAQHKDRDRDKDNDRDKGPTPTLGCTYAREYITSLEFIRKRKEFSISEMEARKTAWRVSEGCTGAAQRFVKIVTALIASGVSSRESVETGIEFSARTNIETETFVFVFLSAFLEDGLDLDLGSSLRMARSLSTEFRGDILAVRDDFERLIQFCTRTQGLNLPRPQCGTLASRVAHRGEDFSGGVADPFIRTFQFLSSDNGPALTTGQALQLAEHLIEGGRDSADNFIQAFKYGISSHGLGMGTREAIHFAEEMTLPKSHSKELKMPEKLPTPEHSSG